jgi:ribosome-binding protein aMBF1 (putative translation factor)
MSGACIAFFMPKAPKQPSRKSRDDRRTVRIKTVTGDVDRAVHRTASNQTQKDISLESGRGPVYISNIEREKQSPTTGYPFKIAPMLDVPLRQLIKEIEERLASD